VSFFFTPLVELKGVVLEYSVVRAWWLSLLEKKSDCGSANAIAFCTLTRRVGYWKRACS